ncbi:MAG: hypothetical protein COY40_00485 [Alphaproteobacteria bacterium CG_4_10_14_0_8_um_filter_53_9]|nr:MAG: hypothetical protein COY40_00485 [Alphaproteobacteria bacterium CG_4_10_14_0_8_um_filter_53_9]
MKNILKLPRQPRNLTLPDTPVTPLPAQKLEAMIAHALTHPQELPSEDARIGAPSRHTAQAALLRNTPVPSLSALFRVSAPARANPRLISLAQRAQKAAYATGLTTMAAGVFLALALLPTPGASGNVQATAQSEADLITLLLFTPTDE